ncbi:MAG TPA: cell envelope integrity protein TolA [Ramlibacter sp.]|nr:cell envelope integrity protein TolA [Ramlibacter sp.]
MPAAADRLEFTPPPQPGAVRAFALAILAHVLLMLALTWGISWNRASEDAVVEAELWSSVPRQAAPAAATAPPVVQAPPMPTVPAPPPPPPPAPKVEPAPPAPLPKPPDIALEQEKRKQEQAQRRQEEIEREKKIEARRKQEEQERQKKLEARNRQEELQKRELAEKKALEEKKRQEEQVKAAKARQEEAKRLEAQRQDNLRRMQAQANATGRDDSTGAAQRSSGPSDSYAGRIQARVRPQIVFTDEISGNPVASVEVRMAPDGTIVNRRLVKSSGIRSWDAAVLRALDKTEILPRDIDGRVHTPLIIDFKPRD